MEQGGISIRTSLLLWGRTIFWLLPAFALAWIAWPHFVDGRAQDAAIPVPNAMIAGIALPQPAYRAAERALARANPADGEAMIARAEAALRGGASPATQIPFLEAGLMHQPASARGWTLLADAWASTGNRKRAAAALGLALQLAPKDYWIAGARARAAARLWNDLDEDTQQNALAQTRLLWEEPLLNHQLRVLLTTRAGVALVGRAFAGHPNELRAMNRWLALQRVRHPLSTKHGGAEQ